MSSVAPPMPPTEAACTGLLGGTFDPIHFGHLRLAEDARQALALERVVFVPAGQPPHREAPHAAKQERLAMVRLAVADHPRFEVDAAEVASAAPSYTVDTLERLRADWGGARPLVLLLGADAFLGLPAWKRWRELFELAHVAVALRPGFELAAADMGEALAGEWRRRGGADAAALRAAPAGRIARFAMSVLDISATRIRAEIGAGGSARYLLPAPVLDYIDRKHLYTKPPHGS